MQQYDDEQKVNFDQPPPVDNISQEYNLIQPSPTRVKKGVVKVNCIRGLNLSKKKRFCAPKKKIILTKKFFHKSSTSR